MSKSTDGKNADNSNGKKPDNSDQMITKSAREFLKDPNQSSNYMKAVDKTVALAVTAIEEKIEQNTSKGSDKTKQK